MNDYTKLRESFLKLNPLSALAYEQNIGDWLIIVRGGDIKLPDTDTITYTLTPDYKLPSTENMPDVKQLIANGKRVAFVKYVAL